MHTDRYNTVSFWLVCVFSPFFFFTSRGSSLRVKAVILGTQCHFFGLFLHIYFIVDISDCFPRSHSAVFLRAQDFPTISKQTDVSIPGAQGCLRCASCLPAC